MGGAAKILFANRAAARLKEGTPIVSPPGLL